MGFLKLDDEGKNRIQMDSQKDIDACHKCPYPECINCLADDKHQKRKGYEQLTLEGEFIRYWETAKEAGRELGINPQNISNCVKGRCKRAGQYRWRYASGEC